MILDGYNGKIYTLNENQEKVLMVLYDKKRNDMHWARPNSGWTRQATIKNRGHFNKNATVVGCLRAFEVLDFVESIRVPQLDGSDMVFYRLTDDFYFYFNSFMRIKINPLLRQSQNLKI